MQDWGCRKRGFVRMKKYWLCCPLPGQRLILFHLDIFALREYYKLRHLIAPSSILFHLYIFDLQKHTVFYTPAKVPFILTSRRLKLFSVGKLQLVSVYIPLKKLCEKLLIWTLPRRRQTKEFAARLELLHFLHFLMDRRFPIVVHGPELCSQPRQQQPPPTVV